MTDKEFIKKLLDGEELDEKTSAFLVKYISAWMNNTGIDINADTIKLLNENKDLITRLKLIYSKDKILDHTERKIILSEIAKGEKTIEQGRLTKSGMVEYINVEPTFNERISAINALNALDSIDNFKETKRIIIDDIKEVNVNVNWNR